MEFFQNLWHWYWTEKAQIPLTSNDPKGANFIIMAFMLWNLVMEFDLVRGGILVAVVLVFVEKNASAKNRAKQKESAKQAEEKKISSATKQKDAGPNNRVEPKSVEPVIVAETESTSESVVQVVNQVKGGDRCGDSQEDFSSGLGDSRLDFLESTESGVDPVITPEPPEPAGGSGNELTVQDVRDALDKANKTQTELAKALGVTRFYVSKVLAGEKPFTPQLQMKCRKICADWHVDRPES